jgi:hypothetical protein
MSVPGETQKGTSVNVDIEYDREREVEGWWVFQFGPLVWTLDPEDRVGNVRLWDTTEEAVRWLDEFRPDGKEPA